MLNRQYGIAASSSIVKVGHAEDSQPNERIQSRHRHLPPKLNTVRPPRFSSSNRSNNSSNSRLGTQFARRGTWNTRVRTRPRPGTEEGEESSSAWSTPALSAPNQPEAPTHLPCPSLPVGPVAAAQPIHQPSSSTWTVRYTSLSPKLPPEPIRRRTPLDAPRPNTNNTNTNSQSRPPLPGRKRKPTEPPHPPPPPSQKPKLDPFVEIIKQEEPSSPPSNQPTEKIKQESPSSPTPLPSQSLPTQTQTTTRKLVNEACTFWPTPQNCQKSITEYTHNRREFAKSKNRELIKLGLRRTKAFFREDGLVIEWKSQVPVWNDTLLPETPPPTPPTLPDTKTIPSDNYSNSKRKHEIIDVDLLPTPPLTVKKPKLNLSQSQSHSHPDPSPSLDPSPSPSPERSTPPPPPPLPTRKRRTQKVQERHWSAGLSKSDIRKLGKAPSPLKQSQAQPQPALIVTPPNSSTTGSSLPQTQTPAPTPTPTPTPPKRLALPTRLTPSEKKAVLDARHSRKLSGGDLKTWRVSAANANVIGVAMGFGTKDDDGVVPPATDGVVVSTDVLPVGELQAGATDADADANVNENAAIGFETKDEEVVAVFLESTATDEGGGVPITTDVVYADQWSLSSSCAHWNTNTSHHQEPNFDALQGSATDSNSKLGLDDDDGDLPQSTSTDDVHGVHDVAAIQESGNGEEQQLGSTDGHQETISKDQDDECGGGGDGPPRPTPLPLPTRLMFFEREKVTTDDDDDYIPRPTPPPLPTRLTPFKGKKTCATDDDHDDGGGGGGPPRSTPLPTRLTPFKGRKASATDDDDEGGGGDGPPRLTPLPTRLTPFKGKKVTDNNDDGGDGRPQSTTLPTRLTPSERSKVVSDARRAKVCDDLQAGANDDDTNENVSVAMEFELKDDGGGGVVVEPPGIVDVVLESTATDGVATDVLHVGEQQAGRVSSSPFANSNSNNDTSHQETNLNSTPKLHEHELPQSTSTDGVEMAATNAHVHVVGLESGNGEQHLGRADSDHQETISKPRPTLPTRLTPSEREKVVLDAYSRKKLSDDDLQTCTTAINANANANVNVDGVAMGFEPRDNGVVPPGIVVLESTATDGVVATMTTTTTTTDVRVGDHHPCERQSGRVFSPAWALDSDSDSDIDETGAIEWLTAMLEAADAMGAFVGRAAAAVPESSGGGNGNGNGNGEQHLGVDSNNQETISKPGLLDDDGGGGGGPSQSTAISLELESTTTDEVNVHGAAAVLESNGNGNEEQQHMATDVVVDGLATTTTDVDAKAPESGDADSNSNNRQESIAKPGLVDVHLLPLSNKAAEVIMATDAHAHVDGTFASTTNVDTEAPESGDADSNSSRQETNSKPGLDDGGDGLLPQSNEAVETTDAHVHVASTNVDAAASESKDADSNSSSQGSIAKPGLDDISLPQSSSTAVLLESIDEAADAHVDTTTCTSNPAAAVSESGGEQHMDDHPGRDDNNPGPHTQVEAKPSNPDEAESQEIERLCMEDDNNNNALDLPEYDMAEDFLRQFISFFDGDRNELGMAYSKDALLSFREPSGVSGGRSTDGPGTISKSTLHIGRTEIVDKLNSLIGYQLSPVGMVVPSNDNDDNNDNDNNNNTIEYDIAVLSREVINVNGNNGGGDCVDGPMGENGGAVGVGVVDKDSEAVGGVLATLHSKMILRSTAVGLDRTMMLHQSFVLRRRTELDDDDGDTRGGGGVGGLEESTTTRASPSEVSWPLIVISHHMILK